MHYSLRHTMPAAVLLGIAVNASAQSFDSVGTRAAGMAGAFVAVADDASAAYWNPAGFASGNFFSIVLDRTTSKTDPAAVQGAEKKSGLLFAMGMPALGLSYYQIRSNTISTAGLKAGTTGTVGLKAGTTDTAGLRAGTTETAGLKAGANGEVRVDTLVTHNTGATLVQSIGRGLTVGATLKHVRGVASSAVAPDGSRESLLDDASELGGRGTNRFDTDIGVMKAGAVFKAGLTIRNVTSPEFQTEDGTTLKLRRQARAGIALVPFAGWVIDADLDLTSTPGALGPVRNFAIGAEGRLARKAFVRGGLRTNTRDGSRTAVAVGASYMIVTSFLVDAQVTGGDETAHRGWGISARLVY